jgi:hypothetical protein
VRYTLGAFLHTVNGTFDLTCGAIRGTFILRVDDFVNVDVAGPFVETTSAAPAPHACPGASLPLPVSQ